MKLKQGSFITFWYFVNSKSFFGFSRKDQWFYCAGLLNSSKLLHLDATNMLLFIQNSMNSRMNFVSTFQNKRKWLEIWKKKLTSAEKTYIFVIHVKSRFWREIWNRALLSQFDSLFTPEPKWFQSETFLLASLVSLTLKLCTLKF